MINKFRKWKDLLNSFQQMHGDYTVMLVPHDGKGISRKDMDTAQIKKYATIAGGVALGTVGVIMLLSCMLYSSSKEARELSEFRKKIGFIRHCKLRRAH